MFEINMKYFLCLLSLSNCLFFAHTFPAVGDSIHLIKLLSENKCTNCELKGIDLVHATLLNSSLEGSNLSQANLSRSILDNTNFKNTNLSGTILYGSSLRGADLTGADLTGADLRLSDLSNATFTISQISKSDWIGAKGLDLNLFPYHYLHNYGVKQISRKKNNNGVILLTVAINKLPTAAITYVARGIAYYNKSKISEAMKDFEVAASIYKERGQLKRSEKLIFINELISSNQYNIDNQNNQNYTESLKAGIRFLSLLALKSVSPI